MNHSDNSNIHFITLPLSLPKGAEVILSYRGGISPVLLHKMSLLLKDNEKIPSQIRKKIYTVFMEVMQNILFYSAERNKIGTKQEKSGSVSIYFSEGNYHIVAFNLVESKWIRMISERCESISSMQHEELRKLKFQERLREAPENEFSIGLVKVALSARTPFQYAFEDVGSAHSLFSIHVALKP